VAANAMTTFVARRRRRHRSLHEGMWASLPPFDVLCHKMSSCAPPAPGLHVALLRADGREGEPREGVRFSCTCSTCTWRGMCAAMREAPCSFLYGASLFAGVMYTVWPGQGGRAYLGHHRAGACPGCLSLRPAQGAYTAPCAQ